MRALRLSLAAALLLATPAVVAAQSVSKDGPSASASANDPVGNYEWSLQAGDQAFSGTLVVTRGTDGALAASITSNAEAGALKSKSVKVNDGRLVVATDTQYGEFTIDAKLADLSDAKWSVGDGTNSGALKIARKK